MNLAFHKNEFSWSKSRDETFNKCRRMYYFQYYGSWGGWFDETDERIRKLYILKQLQTRQMWAGQKVHDCVKKVLESIRDNDKPISKQKAVDDTISIMRKEFKDSKRGNYWKEPKTCALFEHEYDLKIPDDEWKNTADHVAQCIKTFYNSDIYNYITQLSSEEWLGVEKFSDFLLDETKVFVKLDFVCRKESEIYLYDWKTGKVEADTHRLQFGCYCLYSVQNWNVNPKQVKLFEFYLSSGEQNEYNFSEHDLDSITEYINDSINQMKNLLNEPKNNIASEENFPFIEDALICKYCNFRKLCPRWL